MIKNVSEIQVPTNFLQKRLNLYLIKGFKIFFSEVEESNNVMLIESTKIKGKAISITINKENKIIKYITKCDNENEHD